MIKHIPWYKKDKYGCPIEITIGRPLSNFVRIVLQNLRKFTFLPR